MIVACYHPLHACCTLTLFLHFLALQSLHPFENIFTLVKYVSSVSMWFICFSLSLQSGRCQGLCGSSLNCFGASIVNNDCGVQCNVSYYIIAVSQLHVLVTQLMLLFTQLMLQYLVFMIFGTAITMFAFTLLSYGYFREMIALKDVSNFQN